MKKLPLLTLFFLAFLFIVPKNIKALTQWTEEEYLNVIQQSIQKPRVYQKSESLFYNQDELYEFTGTACENDQFCQENFTQNHTCKPNPEAQQNECAQQKFSVDINFQPQTTDFNPNSESKIKSTTQNLQKSLNLLLSSNQKLNLKLNSAYWARQTKEFEQKEGVFPVNGFPYQRSITLKNGTSIQAGDLYNNLPSYIRNKEKNWQAKVLKDSNVYAQALVGFDYAPKEIEEKGWIQTTYSISLLGIDFPDITDVKPYKTSRYSDVYLALLNNQIKYPKQTLEEKYQELSKDYPLLAHLQNTQNLVSPQNKNITVSNYLNPEAPNSPLQQYEVIQDKTKKSKAYSTQPTETGQFNLVENFLTKILDMQINTRTLLSPSATLLPHLINLTTKTEISALEPKSSLTNKTMPINTNTGSSLSEGKGGIQDLTKSYSHYLSCLDQNYANSQIDPGDWASGRRAAGMCLTSSSISSDICNQQTSCNNSPANESLTGIKEKFFDLAERWLGGAGSPRTDKYDQVVQAAKANGVSPIFTLAIWLHESGASNYQGLCQKLGGGNPESQYCQEVQDFGINVPSKTTKYDVNGNITEDHFQDQLNSWINTPDFYLHNYCHEEFQNNQCAWGVFGTVFAKTGSCQPEQSGVNYSAQILEIYQQLTSTQTNPQTPPCYPTKL